MDNFTLKQLRYFEALAQHRHFGRAAEASSVTQPALSLQIRGLEQSLGATLFERGARQVRLTHFGELYAPRIRTILRSVDELGDLARASYGQLQGRLRVGVIPTIAPYLLPALISELARTNSGLNIQMRETVTPNLITELADGRLDTAIVALPVSEPSLMEVPLFDEGFVLVRPNKDKDKPVPSSDHLRDMRLFLLQEGHCFRDQALSFCNIQASAGGSDFDGNSLSTLVQMVGAGLGVTLLPEMAVAVETAGAAVSIAHFEQPEPKRTIGMVWRKSTPLTGQLEQIAEVVRQAAGRAT